MNNEEIMVVIFQVKSMFLQMYNLNPSLVSEILQGQVTSSIPDHQLLDYIHSLTAFCQLGYSLGK